AGAARFGDRLTELIATGAPLEPWLVLTSLLLAAGLGALHALSPGHGKTVVGAYLVGARGTARHAVFLGLVVTATHTIGVYLLGLLMLTARASVMPERLYPWISVASGLVVLAVGASLAASRLDAAFAGCHHHDHPQHHPHHEHDHDHVHLPADGTPVGWRSLLALDIDHLAAVSTIVSQRRSLWRSSLVGALWGLGHTAALLAASVVVIGLHTEIPPRVSRGLELGVALMLIGLGLNLLRTLWTGGTLHHHV